MKMNNDEGCGIKRESRKQKLSFREFESSTNDDQKESKKSKPVSGKK